MQSLLQFRGTPISFGLADAVYAGSTDSIMYLITYSESSYLHHVANGYHDWGQLLGANPTASATLIDGMVVSTGGARVRIAGARVALGPLGVI